jgi:spore germination cell wall hydrolase CwlJ-like protein
MKWFLAAILSFMTTQAHGYNHIELTAAVLILEAGGEQDIRAMPAVMEVIYNRAVKKKKSCAEIVLEKWQFSCLNGITPQKAIDKAKKHPKFKDAISIVKGKPTNYTKGATHYFADYIPTPGWAEKMVKLTKIGKHIFFKES